MSHDRKTTIAPMLSVRKGARAVDFYKAAFGAAELFRIDAEDGAVVAQLSVDGAEFWLADESRSTPTSVPSLSAAALCAW